MTIRRFGADASSAERWEKIGGAYADAIDGPYHRHRLAVIRSLLPKFHGPVVDFGCGEGVLIDTIQSLGATDTIGIDPDAGLLKIAERTNARLIKGGVESLHQIDSADSIVAANVLAYLSDQEEALFYEEARRIIRKGGHLIVTHSNEIFDLFTLNAFTANFFKRNFGSDVSELLAKPTVPDRITYNVRENPLSYPHKLLSLGFKVEQTEFINYHPEPPLLMPHDFSNAYAVKRDYMDTLSVPASEKWKMMFQCSMFGVRAVAI